jgi:hypothetical protein
MRYNIYNSTKALIALILFASCSAKEYPVGKFQNTPIIADGNASDWGLPLRFGDETGTLQYAITNDMENIYVSVVSNNPTTQMRMLRSGIKIFIDPKGKKNTQISINYPYKEEMITPKGNFQNRNLDPKVLKQKMIMEADIFSTNGFINMENRIYDLTDTSHIKLSMNYDIYDNLVFEAIIPIQYITNTPISLKKAPSISVGIQINNMELPRMGGNSGNTRPGNEGMSAGGMRGGGMREGGGMGGGMRGGGGMGGGMRGGGGMGGGMRGGGGMGGSMGYQNNSNNKPILNWYEFKLATDPT